MRSGWVEELPIRRSIMSSIFNAKNVVILKEGNFNVGNFIVHCMRLSPDFKCHQSKSTISRETPEEAVAHFIDSYLPGAGIDETKTYHGGVAGSCNQFISTLVRTKSHTGYFLSCSFVRHIDICGHQMKDRTAKARVPDDAT